MTILLVQTLVLMLAAFLLGASLSCLIRRGFSGSGPATAVTTPVNLSPAAVPVGDADPLATDRFGRALVGGQGAAVPPVFHGPVIEVQPGPAEPAAEAQPKTAPAPPAPPQRDALHPEPASPPPAPVAPVRVPEPAPEPRAVGESYTQVAVAAAAAAALAAAKAKEEAEAAEAAQRAADEAAALDESRFGTVVVASTLERPAGETVDDLTRIHGIDAELKERLVLYGVHRFGQIAAWTPEDVRGASQTLGVESGRIEREGWIEQARILAAGGDPGTVPRYEAAPEPEAALPADGDRLHRIIGIDPDSEALLRANGVTQLVHIAAWSAEDVARFEALLGKPGRIAAESWVEQARFLVGWVEPAPEPEAAPPQPEASSAAGLRSVRSEALRGAAPLVFTTTEIDDLKRIRGIGVLIEKKLNSLGITAYEQVANWTEADIARISEVLDFKGRIERENWIEQARILASGGQTEFSRRVDRGDA